MKVRVNKEFIDKHTGKLRKVDSVFEADEKRIKEIMYVDKKLVEILPEEKPVADPEAKKKTKKKVGE